MGASIFITRIKCVIYDKVYIDEEIAQDDTNYVYCSEELTNATYDVAVKAFNGSIIGDTARDCVPFEVCK